MTTKEMRMLGDQASHWIDAGKINKLISVLWHCCAEICDRLDSIKKANKND